MQHLRQVVIEAHFSLLFGMMVAVQLFSVSFVCFHLVTVIATSPSYFRGFTLIALKEGTEGDRDEDYAGNFQVRDIVLKK